MMKMMAGGQGMPSLAGQMGGLAGLPTGRPGPGRGGGARPKAKKKAKEKVT